jgi:predicted dienelactone hydrolase
MRPEDQNGRRLMVRVWYPAASAAGRRRMYFEGKELEVIRLRSQGATGKGPVDWSQRLAAVETYSHPDAAPAGGTWPTLIFSHGAKAWVSQNTPLMEHLASHGYVVWSVAHPGEAGAVVYPDGTAVTADESFAAAGRAMSDDPGSLVKMTGDIAERLGARRSELDDRFLGPWSRRWVDDTLAVIDAIENGSVQGDAAAIVPVCDLAVLGACGMSFGGAAAVSAAQQDTRIKAAVNLDGNQHLSDVLDADLRVPLLAISSDSSTQVEAMKGVTPTCISGNEFFFEPLRTMGMREDIQRLLIPGATHLELCDLCLIPAEDRAIMPGSGKIESQRLIDIMNLLIGAFFDHVLLGADNGYPAAQLARLPEVVAIDVSPIREWALAAHAATASDV